MMSGVLFKGSDAEPLALPAEVDWVARELEAHNDYISAFSIRLQSGPRIKVVSLYSPAYPIDRNRLAELNLTGVKLTNYQDVWVADLVLATLRQMSLSALDPLIVAGDLNSSETFDDPRENGLRGNGEIIARMNALGLYDCLRTFQGNLTPTFRHSRGGIVHQLDHLYVTPILLSRLRSCEVGSSARIFGPRPMLSDHLPIVTDFNWPD